MWTACDVCPQRKGSRGVSVTVMSMVVAKHDPEFFSIAPFRRNLTEVRSVCACIRKTQEYHHMESSMD